MVSLKCLHGHNLLEEQPKTMVLMNKVTIAMEGVQVCSSVGGHGWGELIGPWVGGS